MKAARPGIKKACRCRFANHEHGQHRTYVQDRCRCDECRAAHTRHMREYRAGVRRPRRPFLDEIAIERAMRGDRVTLTRPEQLAATRRLTGHGYSAEQIAERLHISERTATRWRSKITKVAA